MGGLHDITRLTLSTPRFLPPSPRPWRPSVTLAPVAGQIRRQEARRATNRAQPPLTLQFQEGKIKEEEEECLGEGKDEAG